MTTPKRKIKEFPPMGSGSSGCSGGGVRKKEKSENLMSSLFSRQLLAVNSPTSTVLKNPCYRSLIRRMYSRASGNPKRVFRTRLSDVEGDMNEVFAIEFSPVAYQDHRVIAVGDEYGFLSVVKVGFDGNAGRGGDQSMTTRVGFDGTGVDDRVFNRGVEYSGTQQPQKGSSDDRLGNTEDYVEGEPYLTSLAWSWDGDRILTGHCVGLIRIWDVARSTKLTCASILYAYDKSLNKVTWYQDKVVSCYHTNDIFVHDLRMRNQFSNCINCAHLSSKLTDVSIVSDVYVLACSSNQSSVHLFDLRYSSKLYNRIQPVRSFDLQSPGYMTMKYDKLADDGIVYALGSDSVIRSIDYRSGDVGPTFKVPGGVDIFTRIDVDKFSGILVSGAKHDRAFGFDLEEMKGAGQKNGDNHLMPFFELRKEPKPLNNRGILDDDGVDNDLESQGEEMMGTGVRVDIDGDTEPLRSCNVVALGTLRSFHDCNIQIACGGDDSEVVVYQ